jgi:hypothetical protein
MSKEFEFFLKANLKRYKRKNLDLIKKKFEKVIQKVKNERSKTFESQ